jgi:hypothetical protein
LRKILNEQLKLVLLDRDHVGTTDTSFLPVHFVGEAIWMLFSFWAELTAVAVAPAADLLPDCAKRTPWYMTELISRLTTRELSPDSPLEKKT